MKAVLLAAGLGTRLRPLTDTTPKCMVPINGEPLLGIWIDALLAAGMTQIIINTHYLAEAVRDYVAQHAQREYLLLVHEPKLLGTAGTLRRITPYLDHAAFFCAHADNLASIDLPVFLERHRNRAMDVDITMLTFDTDQPSSCGIVEEDESGRVTAFHEKVPNPPGTRANGAVYLMEPAVLDFIRDQPEGMLDLSTQVLPAFLRRMQTWFDPRTYLFDIGTPEQLERARSTWPGLKQAFRPCADQGRDTNTDLTLHSQLTGAA